MSEIFQFIVEHLQFWADKISFEPSASVLKFAIEFFQGIV